MPRIALALALALTFATSAHLQEAPEVSLSGEAGQELNLPDVTGFTGFFTITNTIPYTDVLGRIRKGQTLTFTIAGAPPTAL